MKPGGKAHPIDKVLHDGEQVTLGGTTLVAHLTPGHTKGCTTWTMRVQDGGRSYDVVIIGSMGVNPGTRLATLRQRGIVRNCRRFVRELPATTPATWAAIRKRTL